MLSVVIKFNYLLLLLLDGQERRLWLTVEVVSRWQKGGRPRRFGIGLGEAEGQEPLRKSFCAFKQGRR